MKNPGNPSYIKMIRILNAVFSGFMIIALLNLVNGCYYYKVTTKEHPAVTSMDEIHENGKFVILHTNDNAWHMSGISTEGDSISGYLGTLKGHSYYKTSKHDSPNRYKKGLLKAPDGNYYKGSEVLDEVHIYTIYEITEGDRRASVPVKAIERIEIYDPDKGATAASFILAGIGIGAGIGIVAAIIAVSISFSSGCSCPTVSVNSGTGYTFAGDIFSGAIRPGLERDDYLRLPAGSSGETPLWVKLTNEDPELQHINLAELMIVDHDSDISALMDRSGRLHTYHKPLAPIMAKNVNGRDILPVINTEDLVSYSGDTRSGSPANEEIVMKFTKPQNASMAKLMIKARNTLWLEMLYAKYHSLVGRRYDEFSKMQESVSPEEQMKWAFNQNLPLSVYLGKEGKWEFLDYLPIAGPKAYRDNIIAFNLDEVQGDTISVKLGYGFLFWEIDFAGMDFTNDEPNRLSVIAPEQAMGEDGADRTDVLKETDSQYYIQNKIGNEVTLEFRVPEFTGGSRTVFLHSKGYYHIMRDQDGRPDRRALKTFTKPGHFPEYSREVFDQLLAGHS